MGDHKIDDSGCEGLDERDSLLEHVHKVMFPSVRYSGPSDIRTPHLSWLQRTLKLTNLINSNPVRISSYYVAKWLFGFGLKGFIQISEGLLYPEK